MSRALVILALAAGMAVATVLLLRGGDDILEPPAPATLADYWRGEARWALERKLIGEQIGQPDIYSGAHLEIAGDRWYLFNRAQGPGNCASGEPRNGVQVRESADRGATWSAPVLVVSPAPEVPWSCAATDGDAVYDESAGKWRLLFQCKPDGGGWNGCYAEREGLSPMGPFTAPAEAENPVIRPGELWRQICDPGDDCGERPVADEGTFNIFHQDGDDFWISFHGWDGSRGFRGIARTSDFSHGSFEAGDPGDGLPPDAILDAGDAAAFREQWAAGGPIGAGAGSVVAEGDYFYALNEFSDMSLACTVGQTWDLGFFRTDSLENVSWEPFPAGNPIVASSRAPEINAQSPACNVLYPSLLRDPATGSWYLMHGRATTNQAYNGIYLYRLVHDENLLDNGDFAAGNTWAWSRLPDGATNVDVPRLPNGSPDGTPYLAFNCGAPACPPEASVYQDVPINAGFEGRAYDFGGTLRTDAGDGALTLAVHQLDARGAVIHTDAVDLTIGPGFADHGATGSVQEGARRLRYQLYLKTPQTFAADNLFLRIRG